MPTDGERPHDKDDSVSAARDDDRSPTDPAPLDPLTPDPLLPDPSVASAAEQRSLPDEEMDKGVHAGSEVDEKQQRDPDPNPAPAPVKVRGRFLGFLGLLAGLAGLGVAGYLYFLLIYQNPQATVDARFVSVESELQSRARALEDLATEQQQALRELRDEQQRERDDSAERLLESVSKLTTQAPPSRREWKVAEVAYLLRIANHRVLMERDVAGALGLLGAADKILEELDDFALYQVRAQLADEIVSLENVESNDTQGLFLRLEAIKTELTRQSVKLPRMAEDKAPAFEGEPGFWAALIDQFGSYLRFRRFEGEGVRPLLAPEESVYLELNLRLMLERAQLAALRREQVVYEQSLQTATDWMATYLESDNPAVQRSLDELAALSAIRLDQPLPDISGSLTSLKTLEDA